MCLSSDVQHCFIAGVSFVITTSIALDRFFAIQLRIRYRQFATLRKAFSLLVFIWLLCAFLSSVWMWNVALHRILRDTLLISCITIACVSYIRVFMLVRQCQVGLNANQVQGNARFHLGRYKSTVTSTINVFGFLLLCNMPYLCLSVAARRSEQNITLSLWVHLALVLVYANSSLNPALYCWRIPKFARLPGKLLANSFVRYSEAN